jgi:hypothetical protein
MPNAFSVEIHDYLSKKITRARIGVETAVSENNMAAQRSFEGQLLELETLRHHLTENFDLKNQKYY